VSVLDGSHLPTVVPAVRPTARVGGTQGAALRAFYASYRLVRRINAACMAVASTLVVVIAVLTTWEAITRYFFRQPAMWTYPVTSYVLLFTIYLALAYTLQKGGHVSVDFVLEMAGPTRRRWLQRLSHVLGLAFVLVFFFQSYRLWLRHSMEGQRDISALSLPLAPLSVVVPLGLLLMAVTYVLVLVDSFLHPPDEPTLQEREHAGQDVELVTEGLTTKAQETAPPQ
jgi:TRAP-type transport system small permease protein